MCGILGSVNIDFSAETLDLIKQRGPDDWGIEKFSLCDSRITLGHRRLSIVDLSPTGHQPMATDCGRYHIIFNGEIYNHQDIRSSLNHKRFRGHSDTETILYALAENGISAVNDFNGIFGFALLDTVLNKLYIARDPFGVKPVYYFHDHGKLMFCSEIKPLLKFHQAKLNMDSLGTLLKLRYVPSPFTLFEGICKISPGHYLEYDIERGIIENHSYIKQLPRCRTNISHAKCLQQYGECFDRAIERQLMSDVDIGILLSGGVDSALVAQRASAISGKKLSAFTVGFSGKNEEDEISDAAQTAKLLNMDHHVVRISDQDFFNQIEQIIQIVEEPLATTSVLPMMALSGLAASEVKVVLTGQGADEPLGGYGRYQSELLQSQWWFKAGSPVLQLLSLLPIKNQTIRRGLNSMLIKDDISRFLKTYEVFSDNQISSMIGCNSQTPELAIKYIFDLLGCGNVPNTVAQMMAIDARMNLADDLLLYTDKITMHHSLECRVPLLDHQLITFIESLPVHERLRFRAGKLIHKKFAENVLPKEIIYRKKKGFMSPTKKWFRKTSLLREILFSDDSVFSEIFNKREIDDILIAHKNGINCERHIFLLLAIKFWMKAFL